MSKTSKISKISLIHALIASIILTCSPTSPSQTCFDDKADLDYDRNDDGYDPLIIDGHESRQKSNSSERALLIGCYYEGSFPNHLNFNSLVKTPYSSNLLVFVGYEIKNSEIYMSLIMPFKISNIQEVGLKQKKVSLEYHVGPYFLDTFALNLIGGITFSSIDFHNKSIYGLGAVIGYEILFSFSIFNFFLGFKCYFDKTAENTISSSPIVFIGTSIGI